MLIAANKYEENIAEYVLYMWHLEDMVRACQFEIDLIRPNVILPQSTDPEMLDKIEQWYIDLIARMKREGLEKKGHLAEVNDILIELLYLHNSLLNVTGDKAYEALYKSADPFIKEFGSRSNNHSLNPVEICLNGQYAKLLLKLQKKEITKDTEAAFDAFRQVLAYLAVKYKEMKLGAYTAMSN